MVSRITIDHIAHDALRNLPLPPRYGKLDFFAQGISVNGSDIKTFKQELKTRGLKYRTDEYVSPRSVHTVVDTKSWHAHIHIPLDAGLQTHVQPLVRELLDKGYVLKNGILRFGAPTRKQKVTVFPAQANFCLFRKNGIGPAEYSVVTPFRTTLDGDKQKAFSDWQKTYAKKPALRRLQPTHTTD